MEEFALPKHVQLRLFQFRKLAPQKHHELRCGNLRRQLSYLAALIQAAVQPREQFLVRHLQVSGCEHQTLCNLRAKYLLEVLILGLQLVFGMVSLWMEVRPVALGFVHAMVSALLAAGLVSIAGRDHLDYQNKD